MIEAKLQTQSVPCASCRSEDERLVIMVKTDIRIDEYCLSCACELTTKVQRLLSEAPASA